MQTKVRPGAAGAPGAVTARPHVPGACVRETMRPSATIDRGGHGSLSDGSETSETTRFVLFAVKHDATYWTPHTVAREIALHDLLDAPSEEELAAFRDRVLRSLVGRAAERFWASDAVTPARAAAIRSACRALRDLTIDVFAETAAEASAKPATDPPAPSTGNRARPPS